MIVCCRLFLCLNLMPVSGVLLKIMLSCDTCCIYLSLYVLTACVLANKGVHNCSKSSPHNTPNLIIHCKKGKR